MFIASLHIIFTRVKYNSKITLIHKARKEIQILKSSGCVQ